MDVRAYLQYRIETRQAARERARMIAERIAYAAVMIGITALWIVGWMLG